VIAATFVAHLWHYLVARLIYDDVLRGHIVAVLVVAAAAFLIGRRTKA
jgi:hypothetical protein